MEDNHIDFVGILAASTEGIEINLLGLSLGVDPIRPALKLPAIGRLGMQRVIQHPIGTPR